MYNDSKNSLSIFNKILFCIAGFTIGFFIFKIFFINIKISDDSMMPNVKINDTAFAFKYSTPVKENLIILETPFQTDTFMIRRIIAIPGDRVSIKNKIIYVNGKKIKLNWKILQKNKTEFTENFSNRDNLSELVLNENEYFVLNDNFDNSFDSREFGPVLRENIKGTVIFTY